MNRYFAFRGLPGSFVLTMLLSLLALVSALIKPEAARWLCLAGMLMSSVGDIFLMHLRRVERIFPNYFTWGAAAFMVAHILYALAYRVLSTSRGYTRFFNGGIVIVLLISAACLVYFISACSRRSDYSDLPLVIVYLAVISLGCCSIFSYAWASFSERPWTLLAAAGALSFYISDFIIGLGLIAGIDRYSHLIWWFYPIGQILIILFCR